MRAYAWGIVMTPPVKLPSGLFIANHPKARHTLAIRYWRTEFI